jgi:hypothetical protein
MIWRPVDRFCSIYSSVKESVLVNSVLKVDKDLVCLRVNNRRNTCGDAVFWPVHAPQYPVTAGFL